MCNEYLRVLLQVYAYWPNGPYAILILRHFFRRLFSYIYYFIYIHIYSIHTQRLIYRKSSHADINVSFILKNRCTIVHLGVKMSFYNSIRKRAKTNFSISRNWCKLELWNVPRNKIRGTVKNKNTCSMLQVQEVQEARKTRKKKSQT